MHDFNQFATDGLRLIHDNSCLLSVLIFSPLGVTKSIGLYQSCFSSN